jgi:hypothetical protein
MIFTLLFFALFLFFIPFTGFLLSIFLFCFKRLRFLAAFAFFIPFTTTYGAIAGSWGTGMGLGALEIHNFVWAITKVVASWFGLLVGAVIGCIIGIGAGFVTNRLLRRWRLGLSKA